MTTAATPLEALAFRDGNPSEWEKPEYNFEVGSRICGALKTDRITEEIRQVSNAEADRQKQLHDEWLLNTRLTKTERQYRLRMRGVVDGLVSSLIAPDDTRDREVIKNGLFAALRPLDERLRRTEWDGLIR